MGEARDQGEADVLVFNTCTIREKADERFVAHLMEARAAKQRDPEKRIVVGGCWSESMKQELFDLYPFVDLAFGPGAIHKLGDYIAAGGELPAGHFSTFDHFAGHLPGKRERRHQAWLQISQGCNSKCSYCIVPSVRGREQSRVAARPGRGGAPAGRRRRPRADAAGPERQLLGPRPARRRAAGFGGLLRHLDEVDGIARIRFTSPHPKDMRDDVIAAMAECESVCEHLHLPLQSGSTRVLKAMRRTYYAERYLGLVDRIRTAIPGHRPHHRHHRRLPRRDRGRLRADPGGGGRRRIRPRLHLRLLAAARHRGGRHGRAGARGRQARSHHAAGRPRPAPRRRAQRRAGRHRPGGAGGGAQPHRPVRAARPHPRQQDHAVPGRRRARASWRWSRSCDRPPRRWAAAPPSPPRPDRWRA